MYEKRKNFYPFLTAHTNLIWDGYRLELKAKTPEVLEEKNRRKIS